MFPGQSSRYPAMIEDALTLAPQANAQLMRDASDILGRDLVGHYRPDNSAIFGTNRDIQVGVFLANHLHLQSLARLAIAADLSVGLSLGEYNHLVHIGALDFAQALRLVDARGIAYDSGPDGAMLAVFPLSMEELDAIVGRARDHGAIEIGSYNSPTQHVLSGERAAIAAAQRMLEDEHAVETVLIEDRIPMHSRQFSPAVRSFLPALQQVHWTAVKRPYLPNVVGGFMSSPTSRDFIYLLTLHVWRPVRWRQSIDSLAERYPGATFVEVGPRTVLTGLLQRRWHGNPKLHTSAASGGDPQTAFNAVIRALRPEVADLAAALATRWAA
jgi:[acyl-carrier-protein] S-malonyltransferase